MTPTLLVVGAGLLHCYTINTAKAMGLHVVCTDQNAHAPGVTLADSFRALDVYDIAGHREFVKYLTQTEQLSGVTGAGGDTAPTVAACAAEAGLPGIPYQVAARTWNKYEVRCALEKAGLAQYQPKWQRYQMARDDMHARIIAVKQVGGFPCIVKPPAQRASRGVCIAESFATLQYALEGAFVYGSVCLLEERLIGSEHSAEIVLDVSGRLCHFHVCDRFFDFSSGIPLEIGHINPSRLAPDHLGAIKAMLLESAHAMGVHIGSWKCDVMWTEDGPKILEATARCSGGFDAQISYPRSSGDSLLRRVIQVACGLPVTPQPTLKQGHYCAIAAIIPRKAGRVQTLPDCHAEIIWAIKSGDSVQPPQHCAERVGFVVREGKDYHESWTEAAWFADKYAEKLVEVTQ